MNVNEMLKFLEKADCLESFRKLKEFAEALKSETCEVCISCEKYGACIRYDEDDILKEHPIPCAIGEFLGETPY